MSAKKTQLISTNHSMLSKIITRNLKHQCHIEMKISDIKILSLISQSHNNNDDDEMKNPITI